MHARIAVAAPMLNPFSTLCCTRNAASTSSPAPATDQHATGAQCSSGAYSGSFCRPPATAAIRAKVASASAENTSPSTLPSAPRLADRERRRDRAHQHAAPGRAGDELRRDQRVEVAGELGAEHRQRAEQAGDAHHDQPAAALDHDAGRKHRDD